MQSTAWHKQDGCVFSQKTTVIFFLSSQSQYVTGLVARVVLKFVGSLCQSSTTESQESMNYCNVR